MEDRDTQVERGGRQGHTGMMTQVERGGRQGHTGRERWKTGTHRYDTGTRTRTLYCIKHLGCMYKGGSNKQFNSSSDISFGKSLSKLYTGWGGGGGGGEATK